MPYIIRDEQGKIQRASVRPLINGDTLPYHSPELKEFLRTHQQDPKEVDDTIAELRATDIEMARAIEDLITVLLKKNMLKMTDLPRPVQDRMSLRTKLRTKIEEIYEKASKSLAKNDMPPMQMQPTTQSGSSPPPL